jgi:hypothetical protein
MAGTTWRAVSVPTQKSSGDLPRGPGRVTPSPGRSDEAAAHVQLGGTGPAHRRPNVALINTTGFAGAIGTPDAARFDILGDVDLRWVGARDAWNIAADAYVSKWDTLFGGLRSYMLSTTAARAITIKWSVDGTAELSMTSDASFPDPQSGYFAPLGIRAQLDVDAGGGNRAATFYTSSDLGATWQQLGNTITTAGVTSIFNSTSAVQVGGHSTIIIVGNSYTYQAWIYDSTGALVANPRPIDQAPRAPAFRDDQGNLWTVGAGSLIGVI